MALNFIRDRLITTGACPDIVALYAHIFALFLLILLVTQFIALPRDLSCYQQPDLTGYLSPADISIPLFLSCFAIFYTYTKAYWELQMYSAPSNLFNRMIAYCPLQQLHFKMYRSLIYWTGLHSLLDANST